MSTSPRDGAPDMGGPSLPSPHTVTRKVVIVTSLLLTLFPLTGATALLTYMSWTETTRYATSPTLGERPQQEGQMVRITGAFSGSLLNPDEYPEVNRALWYRVISERRPSLEAPWHRDSTAPVVVERIRKGIISDVPLEMGLLSKITLPVRRVERKVTPFHRLAIEFKTIPHDQSLTAIGKLREGVIQDGIFDRLLVMVPHEEPEILAEMGRKNFRKIFFLGGITLVFAGLMVVMVPLTRRGIPRDEGRVGASEPHKRSL